MIPKASKVLTPAQYGAVAPPGDRYPINEGQEEHYVLNKIYPTIQGEGGQAGTPMTIVRLQGCPVGCVFCDTPESWEPSPFQSIWRHAAEIATVARQYPPSWALVTGGEPTWYDLDALVKALHTVSMSAALETSGVFPITGSWDYITLSPKPAGLLPIDTRNLPQVDELKWVIGREADVDEADALMTKWKINYNSNYGRLRISLQPMSASPKATQICLDALMKHPNWRLSLQTHKILEIA